MGHSNWSGPFYFDHFHVVAQDIEEDGLMLSAL